MRSAIHRLSALLETPLQPQAELEIVSGLSTALRAGHSLDAAIEALASEPQTSASARSCLKRVLLQESDPAFLPRFLRSAVRSGAPALSALAGFEKALQAKRRLQMKAGASTSQCRAQAEVLSWLPWALALAIFALDPAWFAESARSPLSWTLWAVATGLCGLGRAWIRRSLDRALKPSGDLERWEEEAAPELTLRILSELAQGRDTESAAENSLPGLPPSFQHAFRHGFPQASRLSRLPIILRNAALRGGPVREDLLAFLRELQEETEARWEERVQRLPVALLAPLFACFFPGSLLVLLGLLLPAVGGAL